MSISCAWVPSLTWKQQLPLLLQNLCEGLDLSIGAAGADHHPRPAPAARRPLPLRPALADEREAALHPASVSHFEAGGEGLGEAVVGWSAAEQNAQLPKYSRENAESHISGS